jgi:hypothetical protein
MAEESAETGIVGQLENFDGWFFLVIEDDHPGRAECRTLCFVALRPPQSLEIVLPVHLIPLHKRKAKTVPVEKPLYRVYGASGLLISGTWCPFSA